ncbi:Respiratory nitrate reductase alpha chain [[Actinomadura] parvosata subsp. kistnae]|uniref:nitrate reductase (quinone) n=1 Tax=[Actinomadura] parvosata subsp. kistnae TaxID=1909395 RepID=A0A1V0AF50_9ACTN|nr:nitrate reductase subunit alpha [Nonomuraea sp. ATCC 55076]AQZ68837.1 nitrate reductase subunit alpha [Nonomuraea sp. ATCC 55076]SPL92645.1 Respiratory nitrate reductase alpha chain [Actinomadura parvosata subsp. kistnae]
MSAEEILLKTGRFLRRSTTSGDLRTLFLKGGTEGDAFYRDRWSHDKVVRSTHGVNCTGSCSWKVYVKDGIITWETQETDYPSVGPDRPEYEPRGCPRGAAFSWYTYSPTRVRYPYARGVLVEMYAEAKQRLGDAVAAWADVTTNPEKREKYQQARGRGGLVRVSWELATEMIAAAHVHTIKTYGPDRIAGFSPIPAMSMVSHATGARFVSLIGGAMLSFYDWYADLPVASPQVFGDQTDVPESADWWDAAYLMMWGSNVPVTRTPDAHWMAEARYRGQKVVVVSPDYNDAAKFADEFLSVRPGTDGALAMAMGHVILREFFADRETPYFTDYVKRFTDLPFLVTLERRGEAYVPGRFLTAQDLGSQEEAAGWKTVLLSEAGEPVVPNGSAGFRWTDSGVGRWNLNLDTSPKLTLRGGEEARVLLPRFDGGGSVARSVPTRQVAGRTVTTVYDLLLAQYGVGSAYDDPAEPCTPAWQEPITGVPADRVVKIAREFARTAEETRGRCMIIMGAGTTQWFHGDTIYRAFLSLLLLTGCQGRNGGGWAHYVGQEKCRPLAGWQLMAGALDWARPPRQVPGTVFWYLHTDQWRYDHFDAAELASPLARGDFRGRHPADLVAESVRNGWMPMAPAFDRNPLDLGDAEDPVAHTRAELAAGRLRLAAEDPDDPRNWPRVLTLWRSNLLGSSAKGNEYFLHHLLGARSNLQSPAPAAPKGKLDLLVTLDFRMTSSTVFSDVVLPAATWYEKHDLNSTDMHPFVHAFNPAINPPWETRTDFAAFHAIARTFSDLAKNHLGVRRDVVAVAHQHDTPTELGGRTGFCLKVVERDYGATAEKLAALGPLTEKLGIPVKGVTFLPDEEVTWLGQRCGLVPRGVAKGRPELDTAAKACETILALSGVSNGRLAAQGFRQLAERTGASFDGIAHEDHRIVFGDTQARPVHVAASPEWSGKESHHRRYSPFTINVEHGKPWHTLTGRMHFFLDHDWIREYGEALPIYRPPLDLAALYGESGTLRYLTPHSKWSIHSEYQDNLLMLSLSRGGPTIWISVEDAADLGIADNDWVEAVNRNGVVVARAIVSHRMPKGTVYMYHAQDRLIDVPKSEATGRRGGIHNALTRVLIKPTHLIGGHAQLSYGFNYLGPTGNQRDEITAIRRRSQEVRY